MRLYLVAPAVFLGGTKAYVNAFGPGTVGPSHKNVQSRRHNWVGDLWTEIIEFSTYGPGERKLLKERRRQNAQNEELDVEAFNEVRTKKSANPRVDDTLQEDSSEDLSLKAFQAAVATKADDQRSAGDFDGYELRDILVDLWGAPLDVGFERQPNKIFCSVFPVAFGNWKCQHTSEIEYLMHLQGVIEILDKYDNLDAFINFLLTTKATPKPGTSGIRFQLQVTDEQLASILKIAE